MILTNYELEVSAKDEFIDRVSKLESPEILEAILVSQEKVFCNPYTAFSYKKPLFKAIDVSFGYLLFVL